MQKVSNELLELSELIPTGGTRLGHQTHTFLRKHNVLYLGLFNENLQTVYKMSFLNAIKSETMNNEDQGHTQLSSMLTKCSVKLKLISFTVACYCLCS